MADDLICRVCRAQGSPDNPLYHPCKCSGSMKYVHQECLEEWLSHSRKKHCEICNFKYNFTPIYNPNTPQSISINFFTSIILRKALRALKFYVRVVFAIFVWLILLPYLSVCMFRFWFEPTLLLFDGGSGSNPASGTFGNQTLTAIISNTSTSSPIVNLTSTETPYRIQQRTSLFTPALNFTIEYLQFVASIVGVNDTIWNSFDGAFPLALVHVAGNETGSTSHYSGSSAASSAAEFKKDFGEWIPIIKKFCADVFEGQILLSILIIVAIALLCIKEYIVLNTPVDGAGNPINVPDGVDAAEFLAGGPNALGGGGGGGQAPPAAPAPARRVRRGVRPAAAAVAPQRQPLGPELDAGAAARPADRQRHHNHGHPTASQINTTRSLQNLQNAHQKTFQHALENQTLDSEQVVSLFRTTFNAQQDEAHRHLVANAAHLAVEAAKVKDEEMRGVIGIYREEAVERVKEALSDSGLSLEARSVVLEAFEQSVSGVENLGGGKGLDEIQALVESVEKDLKGTKLRRRSISEEVNSENLAVAETEKVEKITGRLTRSRARAIEMEREKKEKEASFFEEVSEHQPPGKALNTMRSVEEDLEVIRELGMYMSSRGGHQRPVVHRPVIPIRGMVPLGGSSSGAPGGSSSSSAAPTRQR
ncbi:hypothetical protein BDR26DRAFT_929966 [Obelidium mucronatum]|nr:hypothetical protein BDR26DRAFT_929966 [Obelidium mucronatum]